MRRRLRCRDTDLATVSLMAQDNLQHWIARWAALWDAPPVWITAELLQARMVGLQRFRARKYTTNFVRAVTPFDCLCDTKSFGIQSYLPQKSDDKRFLQPWPSYPQAGVHAGPLSSEILLLGTLCVGWSISHALWCDYIYSAITCSWACIQAIIQMCETVWHIANVAAKFWGVVDGSFHGADCNQERVGDGHVHGTAGVQKDRRRLLTIRWYEGWKASVLHASYPGFWNWQATWQHMLNLMCWEIWYALGTWLLQEMLEWMFFLTTCCMPTWPIAPSLVWKNYVDRILAMTLGLCLDHMQWSPMQKWCQLRERKTLAAFTLETCRKCTSDRYCTPWTLLFFLHYSSLFRWIGFCCWDACALHVVNVLEKGLSVLVAVVGLSMHI